MYYHISASLLAADWSQLGVAAEQALLSGADSLHFDVMDNHYVPNLTAGPMVCAALRKYGITAPINVHLMTRPVDDLISAFANAGASEISFHPEASVHVDRSLTLIHEQNCKAGLVINPATSLECLSYVMHQLDLILIMTVNPGFGGQVLLQNMLPKIHQARTLIENSGYKIKLAVDGGIKSSNIQALATAGADTFIVGSEIFTAADYTAAITNMRLKLAHAQ